MLLRKAIIIQELERKGFYESRDGRNFNDLSLQDLEIERVRLPELKELKEVNHER